MGRAFRCWGSRGGNGENAGDDDRGVHRDIWIFGYLGIWVFGYLMGVVVYLLLGVGGERVI